MGYGRVMFINAYVNKRLLPECLVIASAAEVLRLLGQVVPSRSLRTVNSIYHQPNVSLNLSLSDFSQNNTNYVCVYVCLYGCVCVSVCV